MKAQVYVGTYAKYNSGNLAGQWIDLSTCDTYADFLAACANAHKGERDPEYMIQDSEGFPDGLSCMEWITEGDFYDVKKAMNEDEAATESPAPAFTIVEYSEKAIAVTGDTRSIKDALKSLGGRFNARLTCGPGWVFPKSKAQAVRELVGGGKTAKAEKTEKKNGDLAEFLESLDEKDRAYYKKYCADAVKLPEGYVLIDKPNIENRFCFHDEGPQYDLYCSLHEDEKKMRDYFLRENLEKIDDRIADLSGNDCEILVIGGRENVAFLEFAHAHYIAEDERERGARDITAEERKEFLRVYKSVRAEFEKRLQTYLKRYGVSKLHTWTYWAEA